MFTAEDRGWSPNPAGVTAHRVVLWLHDRQEADPDGISTAGHAAEDLTIPARQVGGVLERLYERGLAINPGGMSFEGASAALTDEGLALASAWKVARDSPRARRVACRDAVLDWMDGQDKSLSDASKIRSDPRSYFFGQQFAEEDINAAVDHLNALGLVTGIATSGPALARPTVTPDGQTCVERYGSSVAAWEDRKSTAPTSTSYTFTGNHGLNFAANSPGAVQTVTMDTDNRQQVLQIADALEQMLPSLQLPDAREDEAREVVRELRNAAQTGADTGRLGQTLETVKRLAVSGTGTAAGAALVLMVNEGGKAIGLG